MDAPKSSSTWRHVTQPKFVPDHNRMVYREAQRGGMGVIMQKDKVHKRVEKKERKKKKETSHALCRYERCFLGDRV